MNELLKSIQQDKAIIEEMFAEEGGDPVRKGFIDGKEVLRRLESMEAVIKGGNLEQQQNDEDPTVGLQIECPHCGKPSMVTEINGDEMMKAMNSVNATIFRRLDLIEKRMSGLVEVVPDMLKGVAVAAKRAGKIIDVLSGVNKYSQTQTEQPIAKGMIGVPPASVGDGDVPESDKALRDKIIAMKRGDFMESVQKAVRDHNADPGLIAFAVSCGTIEEIFANRDLIAALRDVI